MRRAFKITSKQIRHNAVQAVLECTAEKVMRVTIEPYVEDKTGEQRGFWHVLLKIISDETGYRQEEVKELVKKKCLGTRSITIGGYEKEVTVSSESKNRTEYSELIDHTYQLAAEAGISLPAARYRED
jgi:hypothetical protein